MDTTHIKRRDIIASIHDMLLRFLMSDGIGIFSTISFKETVCMGVCLTRENESQINFDAKSCRCSLFPE